MCKPTVPKPPKGMALLWGAPTDLVESSERRAAAAEAVLARARAILTEHADAIDALRESSKLPDYVRSWRVGAIEGGTSALVALADVLSTDEPPRPCGCPPGPCLGWATNPKDCAVFDQEDTP